jgi:Mycolic acid cyclopropane synthetase
MLTAPGQLGVARAYVTGALEVHGDLHATLRALHAHRRRDIHAGELLRLLLGCEMGLLRRPRVPAQEAPPAWRRGLARHGRRRDAAAIAHHYEVSNRFYELVLGPSMAYSCAVFPTADTTLDDAQTEKFDLVCRKLDLQSGQRLLDVGAGWGGLVRHAAVHYGITGSRRSESPSRAGRSSGPDGPLREPASSARSRSSCSTVVTSPTGRSMRSPRSAQWSTSAAPSLGGTSRPWRLTCALVAGCSPLHHPALQPRAAPHPSVHRPLHLPRWRATGTGNGHRRDTRPGPRGPTHGEPSRALLVDPARVGSEPRAPLGRRRRRSRPAPSPNLAPLHGVLTSRVRPRPHPGAPDARRPSPPGRPIRNAVTPGLAAWVAAFGRASGTRSTGSRTGGLRPPPRAHQRGLTHRPNSSRFVASTRSGSHVRVFPCRSSRSRGSVHRVDPQIQKSCTQQGVRSARAVTAPIGRLRAVSEFATSRRPLAGASDSVRRERPCRDRVVITPRTGVAYAAPRAEPHQQQSTTIATGLSARMMTSSPWPRPAGCRSVGDAITSVALARRPRLVRSGHSAGVTASGVKQQSRRLDRAGLTLLLRNESSRESAPGWPPGQTPATVPKQSSCSRRHRFRFAERRL